MTNWFHLSDVISSERKLRLWWTLCVAASALTVGFVALIDVDALSIETSTDPTNIPGSAISFERGDHQRILVTWIKLPLYRYIETFVIPDQKAKCSGRGSCIRWPVSPPELKFITDSSHDSEAAARPSQPELGTKAVRLLDADASFKRLGKDPLTGGHLVLRLPDETADLLVTQISATKALDGTNSWLGTVPEDGSQVLITSEDSDPRSLSISMYRHGKTTLIRPSHSSNEASFDIYTLRPDAAKGASRLRSEAPRSDASLVDAYGDLSADSIVVPCKEDAGISVPSGLYPTVLVLPVVAKTVARQSTATEIRAALSKANKLLNAALYNSGAKVEVQFLEYKEISDGFSDPTSEASSIDKLSLVRKLPVTQTDFSKVRRAYLAASSAYRALDDLRVKSGAQLVVLIVGQQVETYDGLTWAIPATSLKYFSVVFAGEKLVNIDGSHTMGHEIGHLMGADHQLGAEVQTVPPKAHAMVWVEAKQGDLMARSMPSRAARFSNPAARQCNGHRAGDSFFADNVSAINANVERIRNLSLSPAMAQIASSDAFCSSLTISGVSKPTICEVSSSNWSRYLFREGTDKLEEASRARLVQFREAELQEQVLRWYNDELRKYPGGQFGAPTLPTVVVTGHASSDGTPGKNFQLSYLRAKRVAEIISKGSNGDIFDIRACAVGAIELLCSEGKGADQQRGRRENRSVDIRIVPTN